MRTALAILLLAAQPACTPREPRSNLPVDRPELPAGSVRVFTPLGAAAPAQQQPSRTAARTVMLDSLSLTMSEAKSAAGGPAAGSVRAESLSVAEALRLLGRVPPLSVTPGDQATVALRAGPKPPARDGLVTTQSLLTSQGPRAQRRDKAAALSVLRYGPEGKVQRTAGVSVTFSQPMKALTAHAVLAAADVPVRIEPPIAGTWRWIDTRTLILEPAAALVRATRFEVTVAAGTASVLGGRLDKAVRWSFETPAPRMIHYFPSSQAQPARPLITIGFDQPIVPSKVLSTIQLLRGTQRFRLRLLTSAQLAARRPADGGYQSLKKGQRIALEPVDPLPLDGSYEVVVGPGTPSAVGPLVTSEAQRFSFRTYGPFRLKQFTCSGCTKHSSFVLVFSNPVDSQTLKSMLRVTPKPQNLQISAGGEWAYVSGEKRVGQTYRVTVSGRLKDVFGNVLGRDHARTFTIKHDRWYGSTIKGDNHVVLDPSGGARYNFFSVKHPALDVKVYAVAPADHLDFLAFLRWFYEGHEGSSSYHYWYGSGRKAQQPPGKLVAQKTIRIQRPDDPSVQTVDLRAALRGGLGHAVVVVTPVKPLPNRSYRAGVAAWVQSTRIGLSALSDEAGTVVLAASLASGKPLSGVRVSLSTKPGARMVKSGPDGLAQIPAVHERGGFLFARHGADTAILPWQGRSQWRFGPATPRLLWHVFDDRHLYRPGETVHLKGWIRNFLRAKGGDIGLSGMAGQTVTYRVRGPQGVEIAKGVTRVGGLDSFDLSFRLPANVNLGHATVRLAVPRTPNVSNQEHSHGFKIEEFRRPEFEVNAEVEAGPHLLGGHAAASVRATYYTGGALADAQVRWTLTASPGTYTPPNQGAFYFGIEEPWWHHRHYWHRPYRPLVSFQGKTDSTGRHRLRLDFKGSTDPRTLVLRAEASVSDVNRQTWTSGVQFILHPAKLYVGIRPRSRFMDPGMLAVDAVVSDIAGHAVAGRAVQVTVEPIFTSSGKPTSCSLTSATQAARCTLDVQLPGMHRVTATVTDDQQRRHKAVVYVWVSGGRLPGEAGVGTERVAFTPDKKTYRPGETAKVLVRLPFHPAEGIVAVDRNGMLSRQPFRATTSTKMIEVPLSMAHAPITFVHVSVVGAAARRADAAGQRKGQGQGKGKGKAKGKAKGKITGRRPLPLRPAHAYGQVRLDVTPVERILGVTVRPAVKELDPGASTSVEVKVVDATGKPVSNAEVVLLAVDESVLALGGYKIPDPIEGTFYSKHLYYGSLTRDELRRWVTIQTAKQLRQHAAEMAARPPMAAKMARSMAGGPSSGGAKPVPLRQNFSPLAIFAPAVATDARGIARVSFKLPDNLTRYRVTAVVAAGKRRFGKGEASITARRLLMVRPSPPRFLSYGDRVELPVVVQNLSRRALKVEVAARASNLQLTATLGWRFIVPAGQRVEVRFPATTKTAGRARLQVIGKAVGADLSDATELSFPVWTPATSEAFAVYGEIDGRDPGGKGGIVQPIVAPASAIPSLGGLDITTSSTALHSLRDAVVYLFDFPFGCTEQRASRVLAIAALRDLLPVFAADGAVTATAMEHRAKEDIKVLVGRQRYDGGFRFWSSSGDDFPYASVHAAHALFRAKKKGFAVPDNTLYRARSYLRSIGGHIPKHYGTATRHAIESYAVYVRALDGDASAKQAAQRLARSPGPSKVSLESSAWLLSVLAGPGAPQEAQALRRHLLNRVSETAHRAHFVTDYQAGGHQVMHSSRRTDAIVLEALLRDQPRGDLVGKTVKGLMERRVRGRWLNTQENAFVLLALARYFRTFEAAPPDFVASVWLGADYVGERVFRGRSAKPQRMHIPMRVLARAKGPRDLVLQRAGQGRLYYRLGLAYSPASLLVPATAHGLIVERSYEGVDRAADVRRDADGSWRIRAGARVRVRLSLVAPAQRYHVALVDGLPAGLEAVNPTLATSARLIPNAPARGAYWRWYAYWFEHQNLRDERVEVFARELRAGVYAYSYVALATTPGSFTAPPAKAEEMYDPETFGRSSSHRVIVE